MNLILIDDEKTWLNLLPLTYTRPVSEIRIGILTIREKWEKHFKTKASYGCKDYLRHKFPSVFKKAENNYFINSNIIPDAKLVAAVKKLKPKEGLKKGASFIAFCTSNIEVSIV